MQITDPDKRWITTWNHWFLSKFAVRASPYAMFTTYFLSGKDSFVDAPTFFYLSHLHFVLGFNWSSP